MLKLVAAASAAKMKRVLQIDPITNKTIQEFDSMKAVFISFGIKYSKCLQSAIKSQRIYKGFLWKIKELI